MTLWVLGLALEGAGDFRGAIAALDKAIAGSEENPTYQAAHAHVLAVSGGEAEARRVLGDLLVRRRTSYVSPFDLALLHAGLREKDQAFVWLEEARAQRSSAITDLKVDPRLDVLRADPRFAGLAKRAGLL